MSFAQDATHRNVHTRQREQYKGDFFPVRVGFSLSHTDKSTRRKTVHLPIHGDLLIRSSSHRLLYSEMGRMKKCIVVQGGK